MWRRLKDSGSNPKAERRLKVEGGRKAAQRSRGSNPKVEGRNYPKARSGFGLLSAFGFRASDQDFRQCFSDIPCAAIALRNDGKTDGPCDSQPRWGWPIPPAFPRVARGSQPWAGGHNPFGIAGLKALRKKAEPRSGFGFRNSIDPWSSKRLQFRSH